MTSEFDIPQETLNIAKARTTDPVAKKAIELVQSFLNDLHYWSHKIPSGQVRFPNPRVKTDHWLALIPVMEKRIRELSRWCSEIHELERSQKEASKLRPSGWYIKFTNGEFDTGNFISQEAADKYILQKTKSGGRKYDGATSVFVD